MSLRKKTLVLRYDGTIVPIENIQTNDILMGPDSRPRRVISTSIGYGHLYQINPIRGSSWTCKDTHVMTLTGTNWNKGRTINIKLKNHLSNCTAKNESIDRNWKLFHAKVSFKSIQIEIDPYLVGLWIGDGTRTEPSITSADQEIIDYCTTIAPKYGASAKITKEKSAAYRIRFSIGRRGHDKGGRKQPSILRRFFAKLASTGSKLIPPEYLINTHENRMYLLAGIVDTDGYLSEGGYEIAVVNKILANQIAFLARSLGFFVTISTKRTSIKSTGFVGKAERLFISGDVGSIPCRLPRRRTGPRRQIKRPLVTGWSATSIGKNNYYSLTLDGDGQFLLHDFTVTHDAQKI